MRMEDHSLREDEIATDECLSRQEGFRSLVRSGANPR
jgi:hypothetical protein